MHGLGIFSFTFDWATIASYLSSPLVYPFFSIVNVIVGYVAIVYILIPFSYWGLNLYNAKNFPLFSADLFNAQGQVYNITAIVNDKFELDKVSYAKHGHIHLSMFFAVTYGLNFAAVVATLTQVALFNGK